MKLNREILPVRDFKLAALHGTVWMLLLWAAGHPMDEWAVTVVVLYVFLWVSREVVLGGVLRATGLLAKQARRVAKKLDIDVPNDLPAKPSSQATLLLAIVLALVFTTVVGASLTAGIPAAGLLGLAPLPAYFSWIGWALFGVGLVGLSLIIGVSALIFAAAAALLDGQGIIRVHAITENVAASTAKVAAY